MSETTFTCPKEEHVLVGGYMHSPWDDEPYDVDGVLYCGRCHHVCNADGSCGRPAPLAPQRQQFVIENNTIAHPITPFASQPVGEACTQCDGDGWKTLVDVETGRSGRIPCADHAPIAPQREAEPDVLEAIRAQLAVASKVHPYSTWSVPATRLLHCAQEQSATIATLQRECDVWKSKAWSGLETKMHDQAARIDAATSQREAAPVSELREYMRQHAGRPQVTLSARQISMVYATLGRIATLQRELAAVESAVREFCPTAPDDECRFLCVGEHGDPIIEADTLADAVRGAHACWNSVESALEKARNERDEAEDRAETAERELAAARVVDDAMVERFKTALNAGLLLDHVGDNDGAIRELLARAISNPPRPEVG